MPAAARTRCAMHAASPMAPVLRSPVLVLSSTRPNPRSARQLAAAQASAASALGCVAALVHAAALSLTAGSPCRRRAHSLRDARSVAHGFRAAFASARALLDPTLALLAAARGSSQRRLGARLSHCARLRGGALARRQLAMPAADRTRCAMHAASPMAPVLRSSVLALFSTRPSLCSPLIAAQANAASALGCVAALVRAAALSLTARLAKPAAARARCAMHAALLMAPVLRSSVLALFSTRPNPRYARH